MYSQSVQPPKHVICKGHKWEKFLFISTEKIQFDTNSLWHTCQPWHLTLVAYMNKECLRLQALNKTGPTTALTLIVKDLLTISRQRPECLQLVFCSHSAGEVFRKCVLCMKFKRSLPQNITGVWAAQRVLSSYFLNLSKADFELDNAAFFFSLSSLSFFIFILSSTLVLIISCGVNKSSEMSQAMQTQGKKKQQRDLIKLHFRLWITHPLFLVSHLLLAPFNAASRTTTFFLILGSKLCFGKWVKALKETKKKKLKIKIES